MDFTWDDIQSAVESSTATVLGGPERALLANKIFDDHKVGIGVKPAFEGAYPTKPAPTVIVKAFEAAVQKAKAERLAGPTAMPRVDPEQQIEEARTATQASADTAYDAAETAEDHDRQVKKTLAEAEKIDLSQIVKDNIKAAASDVKTAATAARKASDDAADQYNAADVAQRDFDSATTDKARVKAIKDTETARKAAKGLAERAARSATQARRSREAADRLLADAKAAKQAEADAKDEQEKAAAEAKAGTRVAKTWTWARDRGLKFWGAIILAVIGLWFILGVLSDGDKPTVQMAEPTSTSTVGFTPVPTKVPTATPSP